MQSLSARIYSLLSIVFFVVGIALRIAVPLLSLSTGINVAFYICACVGAGFIILGAVSENISAKAFEINDKSKLNLIAFATSVGFFIDFVHQAVLIFSTLQGDGYKGFSNLAPPIVASLMAIASSFYFFTIGMSYSDFGYDFRRLKVLHIAPVLWAIANSLGVMTEAISPLKEVNSTVKYVTLIVSVFYFYFFSKEVDNNENAGKIFVMLSRLFSYFALMFFVDRLMLLLTKNANLLDKNSVLGASVLLISLFALFHQRTIKKGA